MMELDLHCCTNTLHKIGRPILLISKNEELNFKERTGSKFKETKRAQYLKKKLKYRVLFFPTMHHFSD